jgi:hypothetical protein
VEKIRTDCECSCETTIDRRQEADRARLGFICAFQVCEHSGRRLTWLEEWICRECVVAHIFIIIEVDRLFVERRVRSYILLVRLAPPDLFRLRDLMKCRVVRIAAQNLSQRTVMKIRHPSGEKCASKVEHGVG